ncbi:deoxynucleoside triphosphate triphosphohydrolase SAMHD1-like isoform X4 [Hemibagrus wyckioides]|uniref:deoxynucleoside triphosphate triphosphohydrolase SAMHD1-like isoform X4 n=1 Tax=Hemibagrus wyckioides TaxID=337641 RepID=UPI00266D11BE|nr:deoxynucleoside triphosphate triphosphohydrolase SAMHD1-like isoform X4 [Hemibagrus wyckioides]
MAKRKYKALESGQDMATETYKIFNDSVHGHIEMHPLLVKIIDTPEFQRLRNIKQLGGGYFVFPGASHNRFEHSIGVAHLAGELVRSLKAQGNNITDKDELCIQIAGLCHDLGHGPFSHVFEVFMKKANPGLKWTREDNQRRKDNPYLFQIVANEDTGIDVDKMDYFSRDCLHLGMKSNFSHERFVMFARVCTSEGKKQICMRDKESLNMYELFHVRYLLHCNAYKHRVKVAIETMIVDALLAADTDVRKISEEATSPEKLLTLTDDILEDTNLPQNAKDIINRIKKRDLYSFLGSKIFKPGNLKGCDTDKEQEEAVKSWLKDIYRQDLPETDFRVRPVKMDYGKNNEDPIKSLRFYSKHDQENAEPLKENMVSSIMPETFQETKVMLFHIKMPTPNLSKDEIDEFWKIIAKNRKNEHEIPHSKKAKGKLK